ncbi:MAG: hypothetical protein MIO93_09245, partial [ANME-2 cluster archaeon]|nr:hypothetical protein [ANME-2 cluster archaeon]
MKYIAEKSSMQSNFMNPKCSLIRKKILYLILALLLFFVIPVTAYTVGNGGSAWTESSNLENSSINLANRVIVTNFVFQDNFENLLFNNRTNLTIPTYEGSGQAIHPDVYYNESGWNGFKYWMSFTPLPNNDESKENPSIVASNDGIVWVVPNGLTNPIDPYPGSGTINSDADIAVKNNTMYLWYREVSGGFDRLKMRNSTNGVNWSNETASLELISYELVSPTVIYNNTEDKFYMWYVDSGGAGYAATSTNIYLRNSTDGVTWGGAQSVSLPLPNKIAWHIQVSFIPELNEYWMVVSSGTGTASSNGNGELYFAYSIDKVNWTVLPGPVIGIGRDWDSFQLYRSAILYINSTVKIWYSAIDTGWTGNWYTGYAETSLSDLKKSYHWVYKSGDKNGWFYRNNTQVKSGIYSSVLSFDNLINQYIGISRNVSHGTNNITFEIDMYDDGTNPILEWFRIANNTGKEVGIGAFTGKSSTKYVFHDTAYIYTNTSIDRTVGWHRFRIQIRNDRKVLFFIDDANVGTLDTQFSDPVFSEIYGGYYSGGASIYLDNLNVYKYSNGNLTTWYDAGSVNVTSQ